MSSGSCAPRSASALWRRCCGSGGCPLIPRRSPALVQHEAPELEQRCRPHLQATTDSWRVEETSGKVQGVWLSLDRAVDSAGKTLECLLSQTRAASAAQRFFSKALGAAHPVVPRVITVDKNAASPTALGERKAAGAVPVSGELRPVK